MNSPQLPTADELRELGNASVRNGKFKEALPHYSDAIRLNDKDPILYSNRSLAFLKEKHYYYALDDAESAIRLDSTWAKAHFRKAEVLAAVGQYDSALLCYGKAIQLQPGDRSIIAAAQKCATLSNQQADYERRLPWVGAGVGIILGVIISLSDHLLATSPTLKHPALMVFFVMMISSFGYIFARCMRYYKRLSKKSMLEPPIDLLDEFKEEEQSTVEEEEPHSNRARYTRAQARMRFRKGKS